MNPVYLVLAGWYWKFLGKKVFLWYTHRQTDLKLRIATFFTNRVFTASPEGFQLTTKKKTVLGHGINLERFNRSPKKKSGDTYFKIVHVGRITPIKNIDVLIEAVYLLKKKNIPVRLSLVGPATTPQETKEKDHLIELIKRYTLQAQVDFLGGISFEKLPEVFQKADISVNLAPTGGMDKAVLESLASATPALFSNKAFYALYGSYASELFFTERDVNSLCIGLEAFWVKSNEEKERMGNLLQQWVREEHNLSKLIKKIYTYGLE
jgi:glycosyltransferase involved in cell wall biosynthesis